MKEEVFNKGFLSGYYSIEAAQEKAAGKDPVNLIDRIISDIEKQSGKAKQDDDAADLNDPNITHSDYVAPKKEVVPLADKGAIDFSKLESLFKKTDEVQ